MSFYYLTTSLTPLEFGDVSDFSFLELFDRYEETLSSAEKKDFYTVRLFFDIENIKRLLISRSAPIDLDPRANLSKKELKRALDNKTCFPDYVLDFLEAHQASKDALIHFQELVALYFEHEIKAASGFLKQYLEFEREWRLILTAFRAKKLKKLIAKELYFEDPKEPMVEFLLSQKESPYLEPPFGYEDLHELLLSVKDKPLNQYRSLEEYRFKKLRQFVADRPFTFDYFLSYALRVVILENLRNLDERKGKEILNSILKDRE